MAVKDYFAGVTGALSGALLPVHTEPAGLCHLERTARLVLGRIEAFHDDEPGSGSAAMCAAAPRKQRVKACGEASLSKLFQLCTGQRYDLGGRVHFDQGGLNAGHRYSGIYRF
jgi:hypothetical protein